MTGSGNKAAFGHIGFVGLFACQLLLGQSIGQLLRAILYPCFKYRFVFTEGGNIGKGGHETTAFNWITTHLNHTTIFTNAFKFMCAAQFHPVNTLTHVFFNRARATFTPFCVIANQVGNWATDVDNIFRIIK